MIALLLAVVGVSVAAEHHVVRTGDTVAQIAGALGDRQLAAEIRRLNGLSPAAEPTVGQILSLPAIGDHIDDQATLLAIRGAVETRGPSGPAPAVIGAPLPLGTTICTGVDGFATVRLAVSLVDGGHDDLTMFPTTCLTVDGTSSRTGSRSSLVSMQSGSVSVRASTRTRGAVTVLTPSGVTTGEEGGFRVHVEPTAGRTESVDGATTVFGAAASLELDVGYGSRTEAGKAPSPPVKLLLPGTPQAPVDGATLRRPDFRWTPMDRALGYRVEIAASPDFADLLTVETVRQTEWNPERLFLPYRIPGLWWRVASVDRTGFIGRASEVHALTLPKALGP